MHHTPAMISKNVSVPNIYYSIPSWTPINKIQPKVDYTSKVLCANSATNKSNKMFPMYNYWTLRRKNASLYGKFMRSIYSVHKYNLKIISR